jgi:hypothetical protein
MAEPLGDKSLSLEQRMEVFLALVQAQDGNMSVRQSRTATAERFGLSEQQVRKVEQEGLDGEWPPLG